MIAHVFMLFLRSPEVGGTGLPTWSVVVRGRFVVFGQCG